jgi:hypothetical protein
MIGTSGNMWGHRHGNTWPVVSNNLKMLSNGNSQIQLIIN